MYRKALSVVAPWGAAIAAGEKRLEVRSWQPTSLPLLDLVIVENGKRLTQPEETDPHGLAVALVDVPSVAPWRPEDAAAACSAWEPGWVAWSLTNVRPLVPGVSVEAKRKLYDVWIDPAVLAERLRTCANGS